MCAALWEERSLTQSVLMRQCLPAAHVALFDELAQFMRDPQQRRVMESSALHSLASHLRTGQSYCRALAQVARTMHDQLEHRVALDQSGDTVSNGWSPTLLHLRRLDVAARCEARLARENKTDTGPLSDVARCLGARRKVAVAHMLTNRFAREEQQ